MSTQNDATMTVTNVSSGLNLAVTSTASTVQSNSQILALAGFDLSTQQSNSGLEYNLVTLNNKALDSAPPTVTVQNQYAQVEGYSEVDMTLDYAEIPESSSIEVISSIESFNVSKRDISGTNNIGLMGKNLGPINAKFIIKLWIPAQASLSAESFVSISLARIEASSDGPVKKILMGKTVVQLA